MSEGEESGCRCNNNKLLETNLAANAAMLSSGRMFGTGRATLGAYSAARASKSGLQKSSRGSPGRLDGDDMQARKC